ncbi:MAG: lyase family protein [Sutterella sp.]|nr:lyase family protein [Sutterella sp.]
MRSAWAGTGLGADPGYMDALYRHLSDIYGEEVRPTASLFDGLQNADFFVTVSGLVKEVATLLSKITRDLRLMRSGPRSGFMEVRLPP